MVKKLLAAVFVAAMLFILAVSAAAVPEGTVGKFTPAIDGDKDEAYGQSFSFGIFEQESVVQGEGFHSTFGDTATTMDATVSYLWDDEFLYALVEVKMDNLAEKGDGYIMDSDNPWEADSVELWLLWTDLDDNAERLKTSVEPFHGKEWGDGPYYEEIAPNGKAVTKVTDAGYNAEFKVAIPKDYLKDGSKIKASLQINNFYADQDGTIAVGQQIGDTEAASILTLGAEIAVAEPETEAETEAEPEAEAETQAEEPPVIDDNAQGGADIAVEGHSVPPQTGDSAVFFILGILALAGIVTFTMKKSSVK